MVTYCWGRFLSVLLFRCLRVCLSFISTSARCCNLRVFRLRSGALDWDEFWWTLSSLGLGLGDEEIANLQEKAKLNASGELEWRAFLPLAAELLRHTFEDHPWAEVRGEMKPGGLVFLCPSAS